MTKAANRAAAKAYAKARDQELRDEIERNRIMANLEIIGPFWSFLLKSGAPDDLRTKLDDWVEELTGDRAYFHSGDSSRPQSRIKLPHERKKPATAALAGR